MIFFKFWQFLKILTIFDNFLTILINETIETIFKFFWTIFLWQFLIFLSIFDNFWQFWQFWHIFWQIWQFFLTILTNETIFFWQFLTIFDNFYKWDNSDNFLTILTIEKTVLETCDIWDTDYNSYNWEPLFMTIIVTWQLIAMFHKRLYFAVPALMLL